MTSWWDGRSRAPLRAGIAVAAGLDLLWLARQLHGAVPTGVTHPLAPAWLVGLGTHAAATWLCAAVGAGALACLALGRAQLRSALIGLAALALLAESHAALAGGPHRNVFAVGTVLLGWAIGLAWGRGLGGPAREDLAEAGALATLAATYVAAALSKLAARGLGWADDLTLRDLLLSQHRVSDHGLSERLVAFIVENPALARALALAALVIQLAAFLMVLSPRLRVVVGGLLLLFHLQVSLLTGILYSGNLRLLALLCVPWPAWGPLSRLLARLPAPPPPRTAAPGVERRVALAALALAVAAVAAVWLSPVRDYTLLHHRR